MLCCLLLFMILQGKRSFHSVFGGGWRQLGLADMEIAHCSTHTLLPERGNVLQAALRALEGGPEGGYLDMCPVLSGVHDLHISSHHSGTPVFVD